jgi:hypothetical protein
VPAPIIPHPGHPRGTLAPPPVVQRRPNHDSGPGNSPEPSCFRWGGPTDRSHTSSSWLNLVERWFAELTNRKLRRSAHRSVTELEDDIRKWINEWNKNPKPFVWTKSADDILETVAEYCQRITDSRH